jgi:hypothetical protein
VGLLARQDVGQHWPSHFVIMMPTQCTICGLHWSKGGYRVGSDALDPFIRYGLEVITGGGG